MAQQSWSRGQVYDTLVQGIGPLLAYFICHVCCIRHTAIKILVSLPLSFGPPAQFLLGQVVLHPPPYHSNRLSPQCSHGC